MFQQELYLQRNFFQRNSFSRNCSTKSPMSGKSICSMCWNQQPISPNIVPRNRFQGLFFHMSLSHISKSSISKIPIPKHPFDGSRGSVRLFRRSVPSFRHSLTSFLSTFRQSKNCLHSNNDPFQGMTAPTNSISTVGNPSVGNPSKPAFHQRTSIPLFHYSIQGVGGPTLYQDNK